MQFHMNIRIHSSISAKKKSAIGIFVMDCAASVDCFGEFGDFNNI